MRLKSLILTSSILFVILLVGSVGGYMYVTKANDARILAATKELNDALIAFKQKEGNSPSNFKAHTPAAHTAYINMLRAKAQLSEDIVADGLISVGSGSSFWFYHQANSREYPVFNKTYAVDWNKEFTIDLITVAYTDVIWTTNSPNVRITKDNKLIGTLPEDQIVVMDSRLGTHTIKFTVKLAKPTMQQPTENIIETSVGSNFKIFLKATPGVTKWSVEGLPSGATFNESTLSIVGKTSVAGDYPMTITFANNVGRTIETKILRVRPGPPQIVVPAEILFTVDTEGTYDVKFDAPAIELRGESLPLGLRVNPTLKRIEGKPLVIGEYNVKLVAINDIGKDVQNVKVVVKGMSSTSNLRQAIVSKDLTIANIFTENNNNSLMFKEGSWVGQDFGSPRIPVSVTLQAGNSQGIMVLERSQDQRTWKPVNKMEVLPGKPTTFRVNNAVASRYWRVRATSAIIIRYFGIATAPNWEKLPTFQPETTVTYSRGLRLPFLYKLASSTPVTSYELLSQVPNITLDTKDNTLKGEVLMNGDFDLIVRLANDYGTVEGIIHVLVK